MYTREDVEEILDAAAEGAKESASKTLEQQVNMTALLMEQVYVCALQAGVPLSLDLSKCEDEGKPALQGGCNTLDLYAAFPRMHVQHCCGK
jgi:hypothetical protein